MAINYDAQTFLLRLQQSISHARAVDGERIEAGQRIAPAIFQLLQQTARSSENAMQLDYDEKSDPAFCRLRWVDPPPERSLEVRISRSAIHLALLDQSAAPRPGSPLRVDTRTFTLDQLEDWFSSSPTRKGGRTSTTQAPTRLLPGPLLAARR